MTQEVDCKDDLKFNRNRKFSKPMMERRRRARINDSLNELKTLVLSAMEKDPARYNKMEKADILEITVNFLKGFCASENNDIDHQAQFCAGYSECSREIQSYLLMANDVSPQVKATMLSRISLANPSVAHDKNAVATRMRLANVNPNTMYSIASTSTSPPQIQTTVPVMISSGSTTSVSPGQSHLRFTYPSPPASPVSTECSASQSPTVTFRSAFDEVSYRGKRKLSSETVALPEAKRHALEYRTTELNMNDSTDSDAGKIVWRPW